MEFAAPVNIKRASRTVAKGYIKALVAAHRADQRLVDAAGLEHRVSYGLGGINPRSVPVVAQALAKLEARRGSSTSSGPTLPGSTSQAKARLRKLRIQAAADGAPLQPGPRRRVGAHPAER